MKVGAGWETFPETDERTEPEENAEEMAELTFAGVDEGVNEDMLDGGEEPDDAITLESWLEASALEANPEELALPDRTVDGAGTVLTVAARQPKMEPNDSVETIEMPGEGFILGSLRKRRSRTTLPDETRKSKSFYKSGKEAFGA